MNDSARFDAPREAAPSSTPEVPREAEPDRDYSPPPSRSEPVETDFPRSAPSEAWSPPERSFDEAPRREDIESRPRATDAEPAAQESSGESVSVPADERQAS